ncbi:MAG: hypothetical protein J1D77_05725 [Muribaculaceae bacterium]|nr:hypothetical protein [Muribaculaceae bacterium]
MSAQELENRKGCNKRVLLFFIFAILCVAAFLIVGLVRTCNAEHEEKDEIEMEETSMVIQPSSQFYSLS